jgi:hypothetical protein
MSIADLLTSDSVITALAALAVAVLTVLVKNRATLRVVHQAASLAFDAVNALKDRTPSKIDDKAAVALGVIKERLGRELSASEARAALAVFNARHEQEKSALALAAKLPLKEAK